MWEQVGLAWQSEGIPGQRWQEQPIHLGGFHLSLIDQHWPLRGQMLNSGSNIHRAAVSNVAVQAERLGTDFSRPRLFRGDEARATGVAVTASPAAMPAEASLVPIASCSCAVGLGHQVRNFRMYVCQISCIMASACVRLRLPTRRSTTPSSDTFPRGAATIRNAARRYAARIDGRHPSSGS
ncbi:hypothetical protein IQ07DRAFT_662982 [Pyrenochaeta sp. DS3sAY3a]|nr:hypothetical protein IQ07DRAFT_662982 [Pyrenochaeta sp. DS3sAY3a]